MIVSLIAAADERNAIGKGGAMPWHLPDELRYFREVTAGKPVIMGRKTWESLPAKRRPLPGRPNIVVSRQVGYAAPGAEVVSTVQDAVRRATVLGDEAFIIGGQQLYEAALPLADRLYLTRVHTEVTDADAFFPAMDVLAWREVSRTDHAVDDHHPFAFTQMVFERLGA